MNAYPLTEPVDPAPHRARTSLGLLYFGLLAGPVAWTIQLVVGSSIASYACNVRVGGTKSGLLPGWEWSWGALLAIDLAALVVSLLAVAVAHRGFQRTRDEHAHHAGGLIEAGEGRRRFLAAWGMLSGLSFSLVLAFNLFGLFLVPLCPGSG